MEKCRKDAIMMSENTNIMHWLGHLIFFTQWLYFLSFFISTSRMTLQTSQEKALHIWGFLKAVSLEFNSDHFSKAAVTAEAAFHHKLRLTSCPQGENWTSLTLPKHEDAVSQLSPAPGWGTPLLCCHSLFSCWLGTPLLGHPSFMNAEDILP